MKTLPFTTIARRAWITFGFAGLIVLLWAWVAPEASRDSDSDLAIPALHLPEIVGLEVAALTAPPAVPSPIARNHATRVIVDLEVTEEKMRMADGVEHEFWTFGGTVPGSFIRVREGDLVEFRLHNRSDSRFPHNIDLHAVTGPHGGGHATMVVPGADASFTFRALNPGLYVYHCAAAPVPEHVARGMYGLILVEPAEGLPAVDREYYVMQGDFYTEGRHGEQGYQAFSNEKLYDERPDYVLFNGAVGALMGDGALQAEVGETVRLFVGNGGPNLVSSFHVIGEILDRVWVEGGSQVNRNVQTSLVPAGGALIADFRADVPGTYLLVDHSLGRVFNKGAVGSLVVTGPEQPEIFDPNPRLTTEEEIAAATGQTRNAPATAARAPATAVRADLHAVRHGAGGPSDAPDAGAARDVTPTSNAAADRPAGDEPQRFVVTMREEGTRMFFEPAQITVRPGDTVVFEQGGAVPHNVEFLKDGAPAGFDLGADMMGPYLIQKGESYEVVIDERFGSGDHPFVCTPHVPMGMTGLIKVER